MIKNKKCAFCKKILPANLFYKHIRNTTGLSPRCKVCSKNYNKQYRLKTIEKGKKCRVCGAVLTKDNSYMLSMPNLICREHYFTSNEMSMAVYRKSERGKEAVNRASRNSYRNHKEKWITRAKTRHAVKMGKLIKLPCFCGELKVHAHHTDYTKPLEVMWLCQKHHVELHNKK